MASSGKFVPRRSAPRKFVLKKTERMMTAINRTRANVLCERLEVAGGLSGQSRGLIGRAALPSGYGMLFRASGLPVMWMHMMFMRFPIDIIFLNRENRVMRICGGLRPWRFSPIVFGARTALELPCGAAAATSTAVGDEIELISAVSTEAD
jgi:uncharacterized protein